MLDFGGTLEAAQGGDEDAFARLWREFQPGLLRYLRIKAASVAEDLAADIWLGAELLPRFEGDERVSGAGSTTARNRLTDWYRNGERRPDLIEYSTLVVLPATNNVEDEAADHSATDRAVALIGELPPDQSEAVMLRIVAGMDVHRVARIMERRRVRSGCCATRGLRRLEQRLVAARPGGGTGRMVPRRRRTDGRRRCTGSMREAPRSKDRMGRRGGRQRPRHAQRDGGRLADLRPGAAATAAQDHELRGELAARTAFRAAATTWPKPRRRSRGRRTPAVVAASTMAGLIVATTGLSAASVLPGPAVRTVHGILAQVGVDVGTSGAPTSAMDPAPSAGSSGASARPRDAGCPARRIRDPWRRRHRCRTRRRQHDVVRRERAGPGQGDVRPVDGRPSGPGPAHSCDDARSVPEARGERRRPAPVERRNEHTGRNLRRWRHEPRRQPGRGRRTVHERPVGVDDHHHLDHHHLDHHHLDHRVGPARPDGHGTPTGRRGRRLHARCPPPPRPGRRWGAAGSDGTAPSVP